MTQTVRLIVQGKVQGVFFRVKAKKQAAQLGIKGYVRNLNDGSVEIIAQGNQDQINQLEEWAQNGPGLAKVEKLTKEVIKPENNFSSFSIQK